MMLDFLHWAAVTAVLVGCLTLGVWVFAHPYI